MFTAGLISDTRAYFMSVTMIISIPTGSKIFNWLSTYLGSNAIFSMISTSAVFFVPIFLVMFTIGGSTGVILGSTIVDIGLHDTYYVVTHFHFVLSLGTVIAILTGYSFFQDYLLPTPSYLLLSSSAHINIFSTKSLSSSTYSNARVDFDITLNMITNRYNIGTVILIQHDISISILHKYLITQPMMKTTDPILQIEHNRGYNTMIVLTVKVTLTLLVTPEYRTQLVWNLTGDTRYQDPNEYDADNHNNRECGITTDIITGS
jgi:hypothetical protein